MKQVNRILGAFVVGGGVAAVLVGVLPSTASAATATANLSVTATVTVNCTVTTAPLAFGNYDPVVANASADLDGTGTVTVACTKGAAPTIGLGLGSNASGGTRRMSAGGGNFLTYQLYKEASRSTTWGNSGSGLLSTGAAPSKSARNFTVYGRVASGQDVSAGNYQDTVVATVNF